MNSTEIANLTKPARKRRISQADVEAIADLVAMRRTEKEACVYLGINPESWKTWKSLNGNSPLFTNLLSRVQTAKSKGLIDEIRRHGMGDKKRGIRADWRALDRVLTITDQRYSDRAPVGPAVEPDDLAESLMAKMLDKAYPNRVSDATVTVETVSSSTTPEASTVMLNASPSQERDNESQGSGI